MEAEKPGSIVGFQTSGTLSTVRTQRPSLVFRGGGLRTLRRNSQDQFKVMLPYYLQLIKHKTEGSFEILPEGAAGEGCHKLVPIQPQ